MTYSDLYQKSGFKIPSFIAVAIIAGTSFLVSNFFLGSPQSSQAIKSNVITLDASNISATRANVVWRTAEKEIGLVAFGDSKQKLSTVVTDERDTATRKSKYFNHSVLLNNLKPNTQYYFSLTNEKELLSINNKTIFSLQTAALDNRINSLKPAYGTVVSSTGVPERNTLVILRSKGSIALTTISKGSGEWLLPLNGLLRAGNLTLSAPSLTDQVTIEFFDEKGNTTNIKAPIQLISPVSDPIKMGLNYSLPEDKQVLGSSTEAANSSSKTEPTIKDILKLSYPIQDAIIPVGNPLIKGFASPLTTVSVTIQVLRGTPVTVSKSTLTDSQGVWKIALSKSLSAGSYNLIAKNGSSTIARQFTITKSGEQVLGEATESAQLTATPTFTPTATITIAPTDITPTLPSTGGNITYMMYSSAALILLGLGLFLVF